MLDMMRSEIGRLRLLGYAEGVTLLSLLLVAVPLKHMYGMAGAVGVLGPVHGFTFLAYFAVAAQTVFAVGLPWRGILRVAGAALLPFGTFLNDPYLARLQETQA